MKHPYIGGLDNDCVTLFTDDCEGIAMEHPTIEIKGIIEQCWAESEFINITREYLEGKCVKIESPEHGEFVQKLAETNGFTFCDAGNNKNYIRFDHDDEWLYVSSPFGVEEITIPLPPKAEPKPEPEPKKFPQIGDKASYGSNFSCEVVGIHNDVAMILAERGDYHIAYISELSKPKTEAEILRDELGLILDSYILGNEPKSDYIEKIIKLF